MALNGDDLAEIKEAHAALRATDEMAKACRLYLGGKLRHRVRIVLLENLVGLAKGEVNPTIADADISEVVDKLIEGVVNIR